LEFAFDSKALRTLCEDQTCATASLGDAVAHALRNRLADLRAATYAGDIPAGRPRPLDGSDRNDMAVDLCDGYRLVFAANHRKNPMTSSGEVDWQRVSRVKILRIENDHG
jgi:hypothetical protein